LFDNRYGILAKVPSNIPKTENYSNSQDLLGGSLFPENYYPFPALRVVS